MYTPKDTHLGEAPDQGSLFSARLTPSDMANWWTAVFTPLRADTLRRWRPTGTSAPLALTADRGGALVYQYGLGVETERQAGDPPS